MIKVLLLVVGLVAGAQASCKTHDVKWKQGLPRVTQPSRSDPETVNVDWKHLVAKNERCADKWFVYMWKSGLNENQAERYMVKNNEAHPITSHNVKVEPCLEYKFRVSYEEEDWTHTDKEKSDVASFKTEAMPTLKSADKKNFTIEYYFDRTNNVHDLSKASIKFPKSILTHASCIKHIEVTGVKQRVSGSSVQRGRSRPGSYRPRGPGGSGSYGGIGGSGSYGGIGGSGSYPGGNYGQVGGSGGYPGSVGGSGSYPGYQGGRPGGQIGGQGSYGPNSNNPGGWNHPGHRPGHDHSTGRHGRPDYNQNADNRWKREAAPGSAKVTAKVTPPFLYDYIEVVVPIEPCQSYKFAMKVLSPRNNVMGKIENLVMPPLSQMQNFHPQPITKVLKVDLPSKKGPKITLLPTSGVPASCLADFLQAFDDHRTRLEEEIQFHLMKEYQSHMNAHKLAHEIEDQQEVHIKHLGCKCFSTRFNLTNTDKKRATKYKDVFAQYQYAGVHNGKPYYQTPPMGVVYHTLGTQTNNPSASSTTTVKPPKTTTPRRRRNKRRIGRIDGNHGATTMSPVTLPAPIGPPGSQGPVFAAQNNAFYGPPAPVQGGYYGPPAPVLPNQPKKPVKPKYVLFWNKDDKNWWVAEKLTDRSPLFRTKPNSNVVCPADPNNSKKWQYSGTLRWKDEIKMKGECINRNNF